MPQPRSTSGRSSTKKTATKRTTATARAKSATKAKATPNRSKPTTKKQDDDRLAQLRGLVVLPSQRIQEVLDDARRRGHIDTKGVDAIREGLLKQAEDARGTLEALLERGRSAVGGVVEAVTSRAPGGSSSSSTPAPKTAPKRGSTTKTLDPTKLKANEVISQLDGLTAAQLRKVRKSEEGGSGRKGVLSAIDKRLKA